MMLWIAALGLSLASGWFLARALVGGSRLVSAALAALFGPGVASILYFLMVAADASSRTAVFAMLACLTLVSAAAWRKFARPLSPAAGRRRPPWLVWALGLCAALALIFVTLDFSAASEANPDGEWDAMAIWNARARFLASDAGLWRRAVSSEIGGRMIGSSHPGYPLFLSAFVAMQWKAAGGFDPAAPVAASGLIALAVYLLLGGSLAARRSAALGLLSVLVLAASEVFSSQTAAQYSDLLQGLAFLAALALLDLADEFPGPRLWMAAGLVAGLSAWIKNEGLPFAAAALLIAAWRFRKPALVWLACGATPGLLATAALKLCFAQGREAIFPATMSEAAAKIAGAGRWWQAGLGFGKAIFDAGAAWTHPVILMAILALALRFAPAAERRRRAWLWIPVGVTAAAEYGTYLLTTADLDWHISTSVSRLLAQLWPSLLWLFFTMLETPEALADLPAPARAAAAQAKPPKAKAKLKKS